MRFFLHELKEWIEFILRYFPGKIGIYLRAFYYRIRMHEVGLNFHSEFGLRVEFPSSMLIGNQCYLGPDVKLYATPNSRIIVGDNFSANSNVMLNVRGRGAIKIGNNVLVGPNVVIRANNHKFDLRTVPIANQEMTDGQIVIEDDVWIGSNAVLLPNIKVGAGAIIAAGAVVTKDVDSLSIVAGVPARKIADRK